MRDEEARHEKLQARANGKRRICMPYNCGYDVRGYKLEQAWVEGRTVL